MAIATLNFMNEVYNGRFVQEFSVSVLKETIVVTMDHHSGFLRQDSQR